MMTMFDDHDHGDINDDYHHHHHHRDVDEFNDQHDDDI